VRSKLASILRRSGRVRAGKVKLVGGHARGLLATARRAVRRSDAAADDETVRQRVRSDAFRAAGVSTKDVDARVENGFVMLRGTIDTTERARRLVTGARKVAGVKDVSAELRVTEE
jgi:osmotically-inducible protein OsmY